MAVTKIVFFAETAPFRNFFLLKPHFSLPFLPKISEFSSISLIIRFFYVSLHQKSVTQE